MVHVAFQTVLINASVVLLRPVLGQSAVNIKVRPDGQVTLAQPTGVVCPRGSVRLTEIILRGDARLRVVATIMTANMRYATSIKLQPIPIF